MLEMWSWLLHLGSQKIAEYTNMIIMPQLAYCSQPGETGIFSHKYRYVVSVSWLEGTYLSGVKREGPRFISWPLCISDCIIGYIELMQSSI